MFTLAAGSPPLLYRLENFLVTHEKLAIPSKNRNVCWTFSGPQKFIFWATFDPWAKGCTSLDYINANQNWWDYLAPTPSVSSPETDYITKILLIN